LGEGVMGKQCVVCMRDCEFKEIGRWDGFGREVLVECEACGQYLKPDFFDPQDLAGADTDDRRRISRQIRLRNKGRWTRTNSPPNLCKDYPEGSYRTLPPLPGDVPSRIDAVLLLLAQSSDGLGEQINVTALLWPWVSLLGLSSPSKLEPYLDVIEGRKWAHQTQRDNSGSPSNFCCLTMEGWIRAAEIKKPAQTLSQVFCAFPNRGDVQGEDIVGPQSNALCGAVEKIVAPLLPYRVETDPKAEHIGDAIIAGIRTARFVVADLSHHRPNVYYEAGFAQGLGIPVVFTCRKDLLADVHFDVAGHRILPWEPEALDAFGKDLQLHLQARALLP
jgi:hypothetical protein